MSWGQKDVVVLKSNFVREFDAPGANRAEVCRKYDINRDTAYRTAARYHAEGVAGFEPRSSAPQTHPGAVASDVIEMVLAFRDYGERKSWAADKIIAGWRRNSIRLKCPSRATVTRILRAYARSRPRARRHSWRSTTKPPAAECSNDVMAFDGKGLWRGISPLTVVDVFSRFLHRAEDIVINTVNVQRICDALFDDVELPRRIFCDGGAPFGGAGVAQLSTLSLWWIDLGIHVEHVGRPQHNGVLERLHGTLEREASRTLEVHEALDAFRDDYNFVRPHASLGGRVPAEVYRPKRLSRLVPLVPGFDDERQVKRDGYFKWCGHRIFLTEVLAGRRVTFRFIEPRLWLVRYKHIPLALFNDVTHRLTRVP